MQEQDRFAVTNSEFTLLQEQLQDLAYFISWQLVRKNAKNNHTEDIDDITQKLHMSILRAGRYYKRQVYIESCLEAAVQYADDSFLKGVVKELQELWVNKTKHGAHRQKFGQHQEELLDHIIIKCVPMNLRPNVKAALRIDKKFMTYAKAICWNEQKAMGRKITRERSIRSSLISLSEFSHLDGDF